MTAEIPISYTELRRKFISDAFHTLNQPLTSLHCGLEISLQRPRSEGEYRKRIGDSIERAGSILALVKGLRELVEADDPGERFGTVSLGLLFSQLKSELEVLAEAARVGLEISGEVNANVAADPGKLLAALGGLVAAEIESLEPGGRVTMKVRCRDGEVLLKLVETGPRKQRDPEKPKEVDERLTDLRVNTAYCYIWTLGGQCETTDQGTKITLPLLIEK
jgi:two-component system sensor histidine kinase TctE